MRRSRRAKSFVVQRKRKDGSVSYRGWVGDGSGGKNYGPTVSSYEDARRWAVEQREMSTVSRPGASALSLGEAMDLVRAEIKRANRRAATLQWYEEQFRVLLKAWPETLPIRRISARGVETFIEKVMQTHPRSVHHYLRALRRILNLAKKKRHLLVNPLEEVVWPSVEEEEMDVYSAEEFEEIMECIVNHHGARCRERDAVVVLAAFATGMRRSELARLVAGAVDLDQGAISVKFGKTVSPSPRSLYI